MADAPVPVPPPEAPDNPAASIGALVLSIPSFAAVEVGTSISMMFLGIMTLQVWNYYRHFPGDSRRLKFLVGLVYVTDIFHSVIFLHVTYHYTISGFVKVLTTADPSSLAATPWSLQASIVVSATMVLIVQTYLCLRVLRITDSRFLALGCWILTLVRMSMSLAITTTSINNPTIAVVESETFKWQVIAELSIGTSSDICIALCICIGLLRRRTGFTESNHLVDRLIAYTVGSGAATAVISVAELVTYVTMPTSYIWIAFYSVISKVFSNSLMASLNQRGMHVTTTTMRTPTLQHSTTGATGTRVNIYKETVSAMEMTTMDRGSDTKAVLEITGEHDVGKAY